MKKRMTKIVDPYDSLSDNLPDFENPADYESKEAQYLSDIECKLMDLDLRLENIETFSKQQTNHLEMIEIDTIQIRGALYLIAILIAVALYHFW